MLATTLGHLLNIEFLETWAGRLFAGLQITLEVVAISCSLGFLMAYPLARARMSRRIWIAWPALAYVTFFRGTPLLCQLYLVYYGAGELRPALSDVNLWCSSATRSTAASSPSRSTPAPTRPRSCAAPSTACRKAS